MSSKACDDADEKRHCIRKIYVLVSLKFGLTAFGGHIQKPSVAIDTTVLKPVNVPK